MRKRFAPFACAILILIVGVAQAQVNVVVQPALDWQGTGIHPNAGDHFRITGEGLIGVNYWYQKHNPTGCCPLIPGHCDTWGTLPEHKGTADYPVPGENKYSLVGKIEGSGGSETFYIGLELETDATVSGELYLAVNDSYLPDNVGSFTAWIELVPGSTIPTLNEWGMIIMLVVMATGIVWFIIRQRARVVGVPSR